MENIKNEFVNYDLACRIKKLNFNKPCFVLWNTGLSEFEYSNASPPRLFSSGFRLNDTQSFTAYTNSPNMPFGVAAPTWQSAFMFFREKYNMHASINIYRNKWMCRIISTVENGEYSSGYIIDSINKGYPTFNTFEEAQKASLEKLLEIVEKQKEK